MSLHFLIDGYNAIKRIEPLKSIRSLEKARLELTRIVQCNKLVQGNNRATVVFDGKGDFDLSVAKNKGMVEVIFSKGESADELIKKVVSNASNAKQFTVVTDDKGIKFFTRSLGARVISVREFFNKSQRPNREKGLDAGQELSKAALTYQQQEAINRELRKVWQ